MSSPKKHHYIPQVYLQNFAKEGTEQIFIYRKDWSQAKLVNLKNAGAINHYHTIQNKDGDRDSRTIEEAFSKIESLMPQIFNKIDKQDQLTDDDKFVFAYFVALLYVRVPNFRNNISSMLSSIVSKTAKLFASDENRFKNELYERRNKEENAEDNAILENIRDLILNDSVKVELLPQASLMGLTAAEPLAQAISHMKWKFIVAPPEIQFLTSDCPVSVHDPTHQPESPYGVGFLNRNVEVLFPVSKKAALIATWEENDNPGLNTEGYFPVNSAAVRAISQYCVASSYEYVFAPIKSNGIIRLVKKHVGVNRMIIETN